jgi:DNA invertase Pin-like site-specific DNA recombinase
MKFQHLVFYDLSRFSRTNTEYTLIKLKELDNLNITWESYNQPFLSTMGQFKSVIIAIFAEINKVQADLISEKTKLGLARKREQKNVKERDILKIKIS